MELSKAEELIDMQTSFAKWLGDNEHIMERMNDVTNDGSVKNTVILSENIKGETAVVRFEVNFNDGTYQRRTMDLVKIDNKWKLIFNVYKDDEVPEPNEKDITGTWRGFNKEKKAFHYLNISKQNDEYICNYRSDDFKDPYAKYDNIKDEIAYEFSDGIAKRLSGKKGDIEGTWSCLFNGVDYKSEIKKSNEFEKLYDLIYDGSEGQKLFLEDGILYAMLIKEVKQKWDKGIFYSQDDKEHGMYYYDDRENKFLSAGGAELTKVK